CSSRSTTPLSTVSAMRSRGGSRSFAPGAPRTVLARRTAAPDGRFTQNSAGRPSPFVLSAARPRAARGREEGAVKSKAAIRDHPLHPMLVLIPAGAFIITLVLDILYLITGQALWWLATLPVILLGVIGGLIA